jgi:hypothetical protein
MQKAMTAMAMALMVVAGEGVQASPAQAREACKQFVAQSGYTVQDWGQSWNWTVVDNADGSSSVGMRFVGMPPGGGVANLYVSCVTLGNGSNWRLKTLTRLQ